MKLLFFFFFFLNWSLLSPYTTLCNLDRHSVSYKCPSVLYVTWPEQGHTLRKRWHVAHWGGLLTHTSREPWSGVSPRR